MYEYHPKLAFFDTADHNRVLPVASYVSWAKYQAENIRGIVDISHKRNAGIISRLRKHPKKPNVYSLWGICLENLRLPLAMFFKKSLISVLWEHFKLELQSGTGADE